MFDNVLYQNATDLLREDVLSDRLPNSLLFSGPPASGKLTAALELARVLSCKNTDKGHWMCTCPSCLQHKSLVSRDLLITGPRDCTLETAAAKKTFIEAVQHQSSHTNASRYLFIRSIRKLISRFNPVLWEDDDKTGKISSIVSSIDELLEEIDPSRPVDGIPVLEKKCDELLNLCTKLESSFMYDSIPVSHIRNASFWARHTSAEGKKVLIIENAERMQESVRNALLKILEEPPSDVIFILTTSRRGAVMPTILSRVRTYAFVERPAEQQSDVINRVYHAQGLSIEKFLFSFLPVQPDEVKKTAGDFYADICRSHMPDIELIVKNTKNFEPRILLSIFFNEIFTIQRNLIRKSNETFKPVILEQTHKRLGFIRNCYENITIYNQSSISALEKLASDMLSCTSIFGS